MRNYLPTGFKTGAGGEAAHAKARREAKVADEEYREAVGEAETMRLWLEERIEQSLGLWERWERERLGAVKTGEWQTRSDFLLLTGVADATIYVRSPHTIREGDVRHGSRLDRGD